MDTFYCQCNVPGCLCLVNPEPARRNIFDPKYGWDRTEVCHDCYWGGHLKCQFCGGRSDGPKCPKCRSKEDKGHYPSGRGDWGGTR